MLISSAGWALSGALLGNSWGSRVGLSGRGSVSLLLGRSRECLLLRSSEWLLWLLSSSGVSRWGWNRGGLLSSGGCCWCCWVDGDARADLLGSGWRSCGSAKKRWANTAGCWSGLVSSKCWSLLFQCGATLLRLGDVRWHLAAAHHSTETGLRSLVGRSIQGRAY